MRKTLGRVRRRINSLARELPVYRRALGRRLPARRFVVFGRGRSGSTLLVDLLNSHPSVHCDGEILKSPVPFLFPLTFVDCHAKISTADVYGFKLLTYQIKDDQKINDNQLFFDKLADRGYDLIYLYRRNLLEHAVSNIMARRHGFHSRGTRHSGAGEEQEYIAADELLRWLNSSDEHRINEEKILHGRQYLSICYEADLVDEEKRQETMNKIFEKFDVSANLVRTTLRKNVQRPPQDVITNYRELQAHFRDTPYGEFFA